MVSTKQQRLEEILRQAGRVLIAYSGGVDSAYLSYVAHRVLSDNMLAIIADSPSLARTHLQDALAFAEEQEIPIRVVATAEMERPEYVRNDGSRCFHCKDELFRVMERYAAEHGFTTIAYDHPGRGHLRPQEASSRFPVFAFQQPGKRRFQNRVHA